MTHGTRSCYVKGCRCPTCKRANRLYLRARYHRVKKERFIANFITFWTTFTNPSTERQG